ncbi:MAG TPA: hypothetical protein VFI19_13005 [Nocardioides sp.]|nr:hypothetical protein [Nocardioides sp.]
MTTTTRWVIAVVAALAVIGLLIWARGYVHHHGDDVGSVAAFVR